MVTTPTSAPGSAGGLSMHHSGQGHFSQLQQHQQTQHAQAQAHLQGMAHADRLNMEDYIGTGDAQDNLGLGGGAGGNVAEGREDSDQDQAQDQDDGEGGEGGEGEGEGEEGEEGEQGDLDNEEPLYVNAKQYHRILKRRMARARLEELNRLSRSRKVSSERRDLQTANL